MSNPATSGAGSAHGSTLGDLVSPVVRQVLQAAAYSDLVVSNGGTSRTDHGFSSKLRKDPLLIGAPTSSESVDAMRAGLLLWVGELDASHAISQNIHSPTGSFWHAIMHRREGDFSNAKYWYAKCRSHPAIAEVGRRAGEPWDPYAFVDLVERVHDRPDDPAHAKAVRLQRIEWEALFEHCVRAAAGRAT